MTEELFIWVNRWGDFQTYHKKRGKKWVPPWIRTYPAQLDDDRYFQLTETQKLLIHELRLVFASASLQVPFSTSWLCRRLGHVVRKDSLEALNRAGLITICSRTVLERFQDAFWNGSTLEVELDIEPKAVMDPNYADDPPPEEPWWPSSEPNGNGHGSTSHDPPTPTLKEIP